jgi:hypothetical protein
VYLFDALFINALLRRGCMYLGAITALTCSTLYLRQLHVIVVAHAPFPTDDLHPLHCHSRQVGSQLLWITARCL